METLADCTRILKRLSTPQVTCRKISHLRVTYFLIRADPRKSTVYLAFS